MIERRNVLKFSFTRGFFMKSACWSSAPIAWVEFVLLLTRCLKWWHLSHAQSTRGLCLGSNKSYKSQLLSSKTAEQVRIDLESILTNAFKNYITLFGIFVARRSFFWEMLRNSDELVSLTKMINNKKQCKRRQKHENKKQRVTIKLKENEQQWALE